MENIKNVRWDPNEKGFLFFLSDGNLIRAGVESGGDSKNISEDISAFDLSWDSVFYVKKPNNLVYKADLKGNNLPRQITSSFPENNSEIKKIIAYNDSEIIFINESDDLFIYNQGDFDTYFKKIGTAIKGAHFSNDGKKVLFWSNNEIFVYFARNWNVQPARKENDVQTITRYSEPIKNVQWYKDYEHIIFNTGRWVKIIELDPRDHRNCLDLINTNGENSFIRYDDYQEKLYFTDSQESCKSYLETIKFPEPTPFLGIGGG